MRLKRATSVNFENWHWGDIAEFCGPLCRRIAETIFDDFVENHWMLMNITEDGPVLSFFDDDAGELIFKITDLQFVVPASADYFIHGEVERDDLRDTIQGVRIGIAKFNALLDELLAELPKLEAIQREKYPEDLKP